MLKIGEMRVLTIYFYCYKMTLKERAAFVPSSDFPYNFAGRPLYCISYAIS